MADTQVKNETVLAAIDGDERIYCVDDPAGTPADRYVTPELLGPTRQVPYFTDANLYLTMPVASVAGGAVAQDRLHMTPIWVPYRRAFTTLAMVVTTLGAGLGRIGIYNANPKTGQPGTLIAEGGSTLDLSSTGVKTATISQTLNPGMYFLAFVANVAHSAIRAAATSNPNSMGIYFSGIAATPNSGLYRAFTYAALPADESAASYTTIASLASALPVLGIK